MEQHTVRQRSLALPITLVLLVFSLIGNVFLYSQLLQHRQENKYELGASIYNHAESSLEYAEQLSEQLEAILQSDSLAQRMQAKYLAGQAVSKGYAIVELAQTAAELSAAGDASISPETFESFIMNVDEQIKAAGSYEGTLNDAEQQSLQQLDQKLDAMADWLSGTFNEAIAENKAALIRLSAGIEWIDEMPQLEQLLKGDSVK